MSALRPLCRSTWTALTGPWCVRQRTAASTPELPKSLCNCERPYLQAI